MADSLQILIQAILNEESSKDKIEEQIKKLSNKINETIKIKIDDVNLKNLITQLEKLGTVSKDTVKESSKVYKTEIEYIDQLNGNIKKVIRQYKDNQEIVEKIKNITKKQMEEEKKHVDELKKKWTDYGKVIKTTLNLNADKEVISSTRTSRNTKTGIETTEYFRANELAAYKVIENIQKIEKEQEKLAEQAKKAGQKIENTVKEINIQLDKLKTKYGDGIFNSLKLTQIDPLKKKMSSITVDTEDWEQELRKIQQKLKEIDLLMTKRQALDKLHKQEKQINQLYQERIKDLKTSKYLNTNEIEKFEKEYSKISQQIRNSISKSDTKGIDAVQDKLQDLQNEYKKLIQLDNKRGKEFDENNKEILRGIKLREEELQKLTKEQQAEELRQKRLGDVKKTGISSSAFEGDYETSRKKLEQYIKSVYGANAEIEKLERTVDSAGRTIWKYSTNIQTGRNTFDQFRGSIDQTTRSMYENSRVTERTLTRNLSIMEQFKIAAQRIPIWMKFVPIFSNKY